VSSTARRDRVLVVDDAANLRELLTLLLETEDDFEVIGNASDGEQALQIAESCKPDIVLLDLAMPIMDGMQALPNLRRLLPDAVIVTFSGFEEASLVDEAIAAGASAYLEKGSSVTQLVDLLRMLRGRGADPT
jgi:DNA-binding NarL/FixJ family response regulator